jgi:GDPmannose 4,6-dehydratase
MQVLGLFISWKRYGFTPLRRGFSTLPLPIFSALPLEFPQTEQTPFVPDNIYGITKVAGMQACRHYREHHGQFASTGILYNHESLYRQDKFLSKKIILAALAIRKGQQQVLTLGDLSAEADWGYAPDYVEAMVKILDLPQAGNYIVATGQMHTVREFVEIVFDQMGLDVAKHVVENPSLVRPRKARLAGSSKLLEQAIGWKPTLSFEEMVRTLVRQVESTEFE